MSVTALAIIESVLLFFGALGAARSTIRIGRRLERGIVLMASVAAWFILFAMIPFGVFALLSGKVAAPDGGVDTFSSLILNSIPFALVAAPLIGFAQGWQVSRKKPAD